MYSKIINVNIHKYIFVNNVLNIKLIDEVDY